MAHAFISHSHKDADTSAEILAALEQRGVKCWTAPRDVPPGGSYAEAILTAIENASCFVLVYSEHANVSRHVLREVERALSLGINIIPVRFDSSSVSKSLDYLLATVHWLSVIAEPRTTSINQVAERIASCVVEQSGAPPVLGPPLPPPPMPVPPPLPIPKKHAAKGPLLLWIGLALLALAGVVFAIQTVRHALAPENAVSATPTPEAVNEVAAVATPPVVVPAVAPPTATPEETIEPEPEATADESSSLAESTPRPPAANLARETPSAVVRRYFAYLKDRNTIKAYELLSTEYRSREKFVEYTRNFASTEAIRLVSARETSSRGGDAAVAVTFDKKNQKFGWIRWRGPIQLVAEPSGWRIDSIKGLRASSIRR